MTWQLHRFLFLHWILWENPWHQHESLRETISLWHRQGQLSSPGQGLCKVSSSSFWTSIGSWRTTNRQDRGPHTQKKKPREDNEMWRADLRRTSWGCPSEAACLPTEWCEKNWDGEGSVFTTADCVSSGMMVSGNPHFLHSCEGKFLFLTKAEGDKRLVLTLCDGFLLKS